MKIKKLAIILLIVSIITILCIYFFLKKDEYVTNKDINFLIVSSYSNYAEEPHFNGTAIADNGNIYTWNEIGHDNTKKYKIGTVEGLQKYILKEAKIKNKKASSDDLNKLKDYITNLEDKITLKYSGADQGTSTISVIIDGNKEITLKSTGDVIGKNKTKEAQKILKIIDKYLQ